jgi:hypothetical protein
MKRPFAVIKAYWEEVVNIEFGAEWFDVVYLETLEIKD